MVVNLRIAGLCLALVLSPASGIADLAKPTGPVVLEVSGSIAEVNAGKMADFDLDMLEALPQHTTTTKTPWFEGETTFTGPLLSDVMAAVAGSGDIIKVSALNDYTAEIPISDVKDYPVILATRIDGKRISVRDKGPLFVVYPFSEAPELYNEVTFNKSVWQVARIGIE
ncbi:MAG: molybdopterin-dependent oxidoreductase [Rhodobacteraceae bacterium]|nr:molybdopterin-dependent oxidoreductase [Paracoccaceae bacterium]